MKCGTFHLHLHFQGLQKDVRIDVDFNQNLIEFNFKKISVKDQLGCEKQNVTDCQFRLKQFVDAQLKFLGYSGLVDVILVVPLPFI